MSATFDLEAMRRRLRDAVDAHPLSHEVISEKAGLSPGYVSGLLNSQRDPHTSKLIEICNVIDVSPSWILYGFEMPEYGDEIFQAMARRPDLVPAIVALLRPEKRDDEQG